MAGFSEIATVQCFEDAVAFVTFKPNNRTTTDPERTVWLCACIMKNLDLQFQLIREKVNEMRNCTLLIEHEFYLGAGYYLQIKPDYNTILIRKYEMYQERLFPSMPAFTFHLDEFDVFSSVWPSMVNYVGLHDFNSPCSPLLPCNDETCDYCKMLPSQPRV